jgi:hypothetical protein
MDTYTSTEYVHTYTQYRYLPVEVDVYRGREHSDGYLVGGSQANQGAHHL